MFSQQNHYCFNDYYNTNTRPGITYNLRNIHPKLISLEKNSSEATVKMFNKLIEDDTEGILTKRMDHNIDDNFVETYANKVFMEKFPFELGETMYRACFCMFIKNENEWFSLARDEKRAIGLLPHSVEYGHNLLIKRTLTAEESIENYIKGRYGECEIQIHKNSISDIGKQKLISKSFKYQYEWNYYTVIVLSMQNKPEIRLPFNETFELLDKKIKVEEYKAEVEQLLSNIPN